MRAILLSFRSARLGTNLFTSATIRRGSPHGYEVGLVVRQSGDEEKAKKIRKQAQKFFNKLPELLFDMLGKDQAEQILAESDFAVIDRDNFWADNLPPANEIMVPDIDMEDVSIGMGSAFDRIDGGDTIASNSSSITSAGSLRSNRTTRSTIQKLAEKTNEAAKNSENLQLERLRTKELEDRMAEMEKKM